MIKKLISIFMVFTLLFYVNMTSVFATSKTTTATLSTDKFFSNGKAINLKAYKINGKNYVRISDLTAILDGTPLKDYNAPKTITPSKIGGVKRNWTDKNGKTLFGYSADSFEAKLDGLKDFVDINFVCLSEFRTMANGLVAYWDNELGGVEIRKKIKLPNQRLNDTELKAWVNEYDKTGGVTDFEMEVLRLVNVEREKNGLKPLKVSNELMKMARFRSEEMADLGYFSHNSPVYNKYGGGSSGEIAEMFGHENDWFKNTGNGSLHGAGENLHGYGGASETPADVVTSWMNSPGHKRAILDKDIISAGVGRAYSQETIEHVKNGKEIKMNVLTTINFGY